MPGEPDKICCRPVACRPAAGLLAGSLTQSAILGSAGDAIARLDRSPEAKRLLSDNISVAYAVSYLFGTAGVAWFLSRLGPRAGRNR